MSISSARSLLLIVVAPLLCFLLSSVFVTRWSTQIEEAAWSIAGNGGPSVVYLSLAREDVRRIEHQATGAAPSTLAADRAAMAVQMDDFDRAVVEYRKTPDYPGEFAAWQIMQGRTEPFFAAAADVLAGVGKADATRAEALARLETTSDALVAVMVDLVDLNAKGVEDAAATIAALRRRAFWLANARDLLALLLVMGGSLLSLRGARQSAAVAAERHRRDTERLAEMEMFSGRVAHDLREPLSAIVMRCSRAPRLETLDDARDALTRIGYQAGRMGGTIDSLLAFARAAARPAPGSRTEVRPAVHALCAELQPLAAEVDTVLLVESIPAASVACEPGVLAVILSNLVRNAIKFTGDADRAIRRVIIRGSTDGQHLRLEVEDTGPGIPPSAAAQIFEPFVRLPAAGAKAGIGLGLATVKRFVEASGGTVGVDGRPGQGSCFWITLPLAAPPQPQRVPAADQARA